MLSNNISLIRFRIIYLRDIFVTYIESDITYEGFIAELREVCKLRDAQPMSVKWLDDEGDPCIISTTIELVEALRIYVVNKNTQIIVYVFASIPSAPGHLCPDENKTLYKHITRRRTKVYHCCGHLFRPKRFRKNASCAQCTERIWGLGWQGLRCANCNLHVHKRCHQLVRLTCGTVCAQEEDDGGLDGAGDGLNLLSELEKYCAETSISFTAEMSKAARKVKVNLDDFDLLRVIGRGSYAKVFAASHKKSKRLFAIKVVKKELLEDDDDIDWIHTEKRVFEIASNHPFLVGLHSCFQTNSRLFFVIEFVNGGDMMYHMQRRSKLSEEETRFYSAEIACALNYLHNKGIIFRDLKLDNVLLDLSGHIKLTDYGMCKEGLLPGQKTNTFCGTPNYIAPEILKGESYDFSVDWWALGVLIYEMLVGRSPFDITGLTEHPELNTEDYLFQVILEKPIRLPRTLSVTSVGILKGFLIKTPSERLGCHATNGFSDIKSHVFYKPIDWSLLIAKKLTPPYTPLPLLENSIGHFDPQFTKEDVCLTPDDRNAVEHMDQTEYDGFEYINPLLFSDDVL